MGDILYLQSHLDGMVNGYLEYIHFTPLISLPGFDV